MLSYSILKKDSIEKHKYLINMTKEDMIQVFNLKKTKK